LAFLVQLRARVTAQLSRYLWTRQTFSPDSVWRVSSLITISSRWQPATMSVVKGLFVRPFPIMSQTDIAYLGVTTTQVGDKLARGYICVKAPATAATAKRGDPVYVRVAAPTASSPLGSLLLTADATASNTPLLTKAEVMGPGDATGLVEIAYNI
jgi:hypothetical protein